MKPDDSIGFIVNYAGRVITKLLNQHFHSFDITAEQWAVLNRLAEDDKNFQQKELAKRVGKDPTNVTRILDQLERKGWIQRIRNETDRRSYLPQLTEKGRELNNLLTPIEVEVMKKVVDGLSDEQLDQLKRIFSRINQNVQHHLRTE
jgi:DNA-binding MarR family transcriptional regulator